MSQEKCVLGSDDKPVILGETPLLAESFLLLARLLKDKKRISVGISLAGKEKWKMIVELFSAYGVYAEECEDNQRKMRDGKIVTIKNFFLKKKGMLLD